MRFDLDSMVSELTKKHQQEVEAHTIRKLREIGRELTTKDENTYFDQEKKRIGELLMNLGRESIYSPENFTIMDELKERGVKIRVEHKETKIETVADTSNIRFSCELPTVIVEITEELGRK